LAKNDKRIGQRIELPCLGVHQLWVLDAVNWILDAAIGLVRSPP